MSERILKALMQLFSIVSEAEDASNKSRIIVDTFLKLQLNQHFFIKAISLSQPYQ